MSTDLNAKLFSAADGLRSKMDASEYKDYLLGLIFYKYLSDKQLLEVVKLAGETIDTYDTQVKQWDLNNLQEKVSVIQENTGIYQTVKGSIQKDEPINDFNFEGIRFYADYGVKKYDIDSAYINKLLESYAPNNKDIRAEIENALNKLNKADVVKEVYWGILNDIDSGKVTQDEDALIVKEHYFRKAYEEYIHDFAYEWCVSIDELETSAIQYEPGHEDIPNMKGISDSRRFEEYKEKHPKAIPLHYIPKMRDAWKELLENIIFELNNELK